MFAGLVRRDMVGRAGDRLGPGWLECLADAAYNRTKLGNAPVHRYRAEPSLPLNPRAWELLDQAGETLIRWLGIASGSQYATLWQSTGDWAPYAAAAKWLAEHTAALAGHEDADCCFDEVRALIAAIERCVNRPPPLLACGPCPTLIAPTVECGYPLEAPFEAVEITCRSCDTVHNVERLRKLLLVTIGHRRYTRAELLRLLDCLGEPIPRQTMSDWIRDGKLRCRGYLRPGPDGVLPRFGLTRSSPQDKPVYRLEEARALRRSR